jgi:hypothetical protein
MQGGKFLLSTEALDADVTLYSRLSCINLHFLLMGTFILHGSTGSHNPSRPQGQGAVLRNPSHQRCCYISFSVTSHACLLLTVQ